MAVEIPVVIDIEKAFADAAAKVGTASRPLRTSVDGLSDQLSAAIARMNKSKVDSTAWKGAVKDIQRITELLDLANDKMNLYGSNTGSIKRMSGELARLERQWSKLGEAKKFESDGKLTADAQKLVDEYTKLSEKIQQSGKSLAQFYAESQKASQQNELLKTTANTLDGLNARLAAWRNVLNSSDFGSAQWNNAAQNIAALSYRIQEATGMLQKFATESGSIDRLNAHIQDLNKQWNSLGSAEKFIYGTNQLSSKAAQITREYRAATAELEKQGKSLARIVQEEQKREQLSKRGEQKRRYENAILNSTVTTMRVLSEQARILSERLERTEIGTKKYEQLKNQLEGVRKKMQDVRGASAGLTTEMTKQSAVWRSLVSYASMYFSVFGAIRFIKNVRETTAEFELQRVALAGIIQDTNKAESLFKEIKAAAIKSPFQIKELVTYTKQLSAYRIETDKLFEVTTKLADVSAGLGVDMNRLVLAYGQVKSASVLRGQELRQFTEAGIPMVDLLAKKFQELGREGTTTADVFELISKRAVPFSMIADIFDDMTEKGGIFYKMQEKQAETLAGQWSNLKDALSIMYDEIGNTASVHGAMERLISDAKFLFNNWRIIGGVLKGVAIQFGVIKLASLFIPTLTRNTKLAEKATLAKARADALEAAQQKNSSIARSVAISQLKAYSRHMNLAANATTMLGRTWHQLSANFLGGGWISMAITAITLLVSWIVSARQEANRLGNELSENIAKGNLQIEQEVRNFEKLANAAVSAADGSAEQRDALKELSRTYGDIIPTQDLQIEKLRELKGNYESLTNAIYEKIEAQVHEQNVGSITDTFAADLGRQRKGLEKFLREEEGYTVEEANRIMGAVERAIKDGLITIKTDFFDAAKIIEDIATTTVNRSVKPGFGQAYQQTSSLWSFNGSYYRKLLKAMTNYNTQITDEEERFKSLNNQLGIYADKLKEIREDVNKTPLGFSPDKAGTFEYNQARWKQAVERYEKELRLAFWTTDISDAFSAENYIDFEKIKKQISSLNGNIGLKQFVEELQKDYLKLAPQESSTRLITQKAQELADGIGISMSSIQGYLKEDGKSMDEYAKSVKEFVENQKLKVNELKWQQENFRLGVSNFIRPTNEDVANEQKELDFLEALLEFIGAFVKQTNKGGGYQQDPLINQIQERMKFMKDFQKGYEDLKKYMMKTTALEKEAETMLTRGLSLGISSADQRMAAEDLSKWYQDTIDSTFEYLKKQKGVSGSLEDFLSRQIKGNKNNDKLLRDFQSLLQSLFDAKTDFDTSKLKKDMEDALKKVSDDLKRSETVRNFYKNILDLTGDEELAATMSVNIYGGIGDDFKERMQKQLNGALEALKVSEGFKVNDDIVKAFSNMDFDAIFAISNLPADVEKVVREAYENMQKHNADWVIDLMKTYEKTKTYDERITAVKKREAQKRKEIAESENLSQEQKTSYTDASTKKEARDIADIELERLKNQYEWTQSFKDLERVSTNTLRKLIKLLDEYIEKSGPTASPESLKAVAQAREQAQEQLVSRNGYAGALKGMMAYIAAKKKMNKLEKEGKKDTVEYRKAQDAARDSLIDTRDAVSAVGESFNTLGSIVSSVSDILDLDELSDGKAVFDGIASGLALVGTALVFINAMFKMLESNPVVLGISAIIAGVASLASILNNLTVTKANREIKRQQQLIDALEYSYDKLEKAIANSFGSEYIYNYNRQVENLLAQQEAYIAQANAERSKGKKSDEDKIRDFENSARDAADQIEEMRAQLSEFFSGTDLTSAAEDFADAWIDAYKEFESTTDAMSEKFNDMIESMINRSLAAKIMQEMLQPIFDQIDTMSKDGLLSSEEIASIAALAQERIPKINDAMTGLMTSLAAAGLDVRTSTAGFNGISRDIAGASEESILGLAAAINTQNYYISYVPQINENVAAILSALTGGANPTAPVATNESGEVIPSVQQMVYDHLPHMDETLDNIYSLFKSVVTGKNTNSNTNYVAVK